MPKIHRYHSLPSTNTTAFELATRGAAHGEVVLANSQSAGRGRLGKDWQSPAGKGLYFSIIVRPELTREDYPKLTMTTGLGVAKVLERLCRLEVGLKWPNDIWISGKKCCGILAEASLPATGAEECYGIIGIGMNVLTEKKDFPTSLTGKATSLLIETGRRFEMVDLFSKLYSTVLDHISLLEHNGFDEILRQWKKRDALQGQWLEWLTNDGKVIFGISEGTDDSGQLLVRDEGGGLHHILSGDITIAKSSKHKRLP